MPRKFSINLLHNKKVARFTFHDHSKTTLYQFLLYIKQTVGGWKKHMPMVGIVDLSSADLYLSDYARRTLLRLPTHLPDDVFGAFALVAPPEAMQALNSYYDQSGKHRLNFKVGVFDSHAEAEQWAVKEFDRLQRVLHAQFAGKYSTPKPQVQPQPQPQLSTI